MDYKKNIIFAVGIIIVLGVVIYGMRQTSNTPVTPTTVAPQTTQNTQPLPAVDEVALQKQLQEIIASGKGEDCVNLPDLRYQTACFNFIVAQKK